MFQRQRDQHDGIKRQGVQVGQRRPRYEVLQRESLEQGDRENQPGAPEHGALGLAALFLIKERGEDKDQQAGGIITPLVENISFERAGQQGEKGKAGGGPERVESFRGEAAREAGTVSAEKSPGQAAEQHRPLQSQLQRQVEDGLQHRGKTQHENKNI